MKRTYSPDAGRRFRQVFQALLLGGALWAAPALSQEKRATSEWVADFGDTKCSLSRASGPEAGTVFRLEWSAGAEMPSLLIGNPAWRQDLVRTEQPATLILSPGETRIKGKAFPLSSPVRRVRGLSLYQLDEGWLQALSSATGMSVEVSGREIIAFSLPQTAAAVKTLRACNDSLLKAMGVDPGLIGLLRTRPKPVGGSVARWVHALDFPRGALPQGGSATTVVRLTIGTNGRVKDCAVAASSGDVLLDRTTCSILQRRGRFEPAIGADGVPVDAPVVTSLRWSATAM